MSGQQIGTVVGGVVGAFFGMPQLGMAIGGLIGGAIDPDVIKAPGIGDAQQQTSAAGIPRPVVYGHPAPFSGNIIDGEHKARKITVEEQQGKGGPVVESERFLLTSAIRICEGPIAGVVRIWRNGEVVYDRRTVDDIPTYSGSTLPERLAYMAAIRAKTSAFQNKVRIYLGTEDQLPDPALEAIHGVGNTPYYRGTAYMVIEDDDVTDMRGGAAQYKFEVLAAGTEASVIVQVDDKLPLPTVNIAGGVAPGGDLDDQPFLPFTPSPKIRLVRFLATNRKMVTQPDPYAPLAGLFPDSGFTPSRAIVKDPSGTIWFDSGWMGSAVQQADLNAEVDNNGYPVGSIVGNDQELVVTVPSGTGPFTGYLYRASFGATYPNDTGSDCTVEMHFPDPDDLPDTVTITPELPGYLIGSDGLLYAPSWITPAELNSITPGSVTLQPVVEDIAERCGVPAGKLDASALGADIIPGLLVAQQFTGADCLRPTQQVYFYDLPEIDGPIVAVKRGAAAVATITDDDVLETGEDDEATRPQHIEYPAKVSVVTQDPAAEYSAIPQTSIRTSPNVTATSEVMIQSPIPFGADEAKQRADIAHKVLFAQAEGRKDFSLPEEFSRLVPSDCINYGGKRWLIEQKDSADGENRFKCVYDRASNYSSAAAGTPAPPPVLPGTGLRGATLLQVMNQPILRDVDDRVGFYVAVSGEFHGWDGCTLVASIDNGENTQSMGSITDQSVMGTLVTALPIASPHVIDTANTVRVQVNGELASVTEPQLLNEFNACVIGNEVCQFQTATLVSDGVYDLSILARGRLDTDPADHAIGDRFVLLGRHVFIEAPAVWIGRTITLRAVTNGTVTDSNAAISFVWSPAEIQVEWEPVQFVGSRDASNNVTCSWSERGRLGTNSSPYHSAYFAGYRVSITKGATTVVKSSASRSYAYSAAEQTIDFGSATGTLTISVVAMNRITGASAALTGTVA